MLLGVHCPVVRGFDHALATARRLGCRAMQMLPYRRHHEPTSAELSSFRDARGASQVAKLVIHSRFVPSIASSDERRRARSAFLLGRELSLAAALGADAYVLHAGAYSPGSSPDEGMRWLCEGLGRAAPGVRILLENVPGGGRRMGGTLEELAAALERAPLGPAGLGVCLDTAHAWAAGYDIASAEGMLRFLARVHRVIGSDRVGAFHLADSKALLGARRENHWHCGEGYMGKEGLKVLLERPEYAETPAIVETPGGEDVHRRDLDFLRRLAAPTAA
ncbi:MAG: deoxyribonuclease IV [Elusimicrobia bacterium]|nr:deoxyribonuclease IV [Elusimicrobiota bacterium]